MINKQKLIAPIEALADFLTEVWALLRADKNKSPEITYDSSLNSTNDFEAAQAMYVVDDNLILISDAFTKADWQLYGRIVKQAVHELYHAFQVQIIGRILNYELYNADGSIRPEYYQDKNEIEAHAFAECFEQYWLKITTGNKHTPTIPDCDLLPKYPFEKAYKKFESRYYPSILRDSKKWNSLTKALLQSLKLI